MSRAGSRLQVALYGVFLVSCTVATVLGLLFIWVVRIDELWGRVMGTCVLVAVASALTMSATRLVVGRPPEDD